MLFTCPVVGTGTESNPKRPLINNYQTDSWQRIKDNGSHWIVEVNATDDVIQQIEADPAIERV